MISHCYRRKAHVMHLLVNLATSLGMVIYPASSISLKNNMIATKTSSANHSGYKAYLTKVLCHCLLAAVTKRLIKLVMCDVSSS